MARSFAWWKVVVAVGLIVPLAASVSYAQIPGLMLDDIEDLPPIQEASDANDAGFNEVALAGEPSSTPETEIELIRERYADGKVRVEREVTQDADENYVNHGLWKMWDRQGRLVGEGRYRSDLRDGTWNRWFHKDEAKMLLTMPYREYVAPFVSQASFKEGKLHGKWIIFDSKQRKVSEWHFVDGERHGKQTWWFANGRKMRDVDYRNGEMDGEELVWDAAGKQLSKDTYQSGRKLAMKTAKYKAGQKHTQGMYLFAKHVVKTLDDWWNLRIAEYVKQGKDEKHGVWTSWYANGQKKMEGRYEYDMPVGKFGWWYPNGQKASQGVYANGVAHGKWIWWHKTGQKSARGEYVRGSQVGRWTWWHTTGKVASKSEIVADGKARVVDLPQPTTQDTSPLKADAEKPAPTLKR